VSPFTWGDGFDLTPQGFNAHNPSRPFWFQLSPPAPGWTFQLFQLRGGSPQRWFIQLNVARTGVGSAQWRSTVQDQIPILPLLLPFFSQSPANWYAAPPIGVLLDLVPYSELSSDFCTGQ
jgi:hypothetical protein